MEHEFSNYPSIEDTRLATEKVYNILEPEGHRFMVFAMCSDVQNAHHPRYVSVQATMDKIKGEMEKSGDERVPLAALLRTNIQRPEEAMGVMAALFGFVREHGGVSHLLELIKMSLESIFEFDEQIFELHDDVSGDMH